MMKRYFYIAGLLTLLIVASTSTYAQSSAEIWLRITDNVGGVPVNLLFGNHINATFGIDSLNPILKEKETPPPQPGLSGTWKRPHADATYPSAGLLKYDFRYGITNDTQKDTFKIYFVQADNPDADITFTWPDAAYLGARCVSMTIKFGVDPAIDMFSQTSATILAAGTNGYSIATIIKTGVKIIDAVKEPKTNVAPQQFMLHENYPNPFNPTTTVTFDVLKSSYVELAVYNVLGQKVQTLVSENLKAGSGYTTTWNAKNSMGNDVSTGMYFVRMTAHANDGSPDFSASQKLLLLK